MPLLFRKIKYFSKTRSRKASVILRFSCDEFWKNIDVTEIIRGYFIDVTDDTVRKNADRYRDGYQINQKRTVQERSTLHGHFVFAPLKDFQLRFFVFANPMLTSDIRICHSSPIATCCYSLLQEWAFSTFCFIRARLMVDLCIAALIDFNIRSCERILWSCLKFFLPFKTCPSVLRWTWKRG